MQYAKENNLFDRKSRILMGVSGGIDSMVMAHLFIASGINTGIAHCNFSLRGREADLDEGLAGDFASSNNIPFYKIRFDTAGFASSKHISVQMAARELRYEWFEKTRQENGYDLIAVAHNLNDNIETLLINLVRGTGLTGLTGIRPVVNKIIRPMLFATREKIKEYSIEHSVIYREDRSNAETKYIRNRIRHLIIPVLKDINPSVEMTLNETCKRLSSLDRIISGQIGEIRKRTSVVSGDKTVFNVNKLTELHPDKALIFELFSLYGINGSLSGTLEAMLKGKTGKTINTGTHRIIRNRNEIIVTPVRKSAGKIYRIECIDDFSDIPGIESAEIKDAGPDFEIPYDRRIACIDINKAGFPFIIRSWEKGDYFYPLGLGGRKKLSDYFTDRKFSLPDKEEARILESGGMVVWIIGERIDDRVRVTDSTSKVLLIRLLPCRSEEDQQGQ